MKARGVGFVSINKLVAIALVATALGAITVTPAFAHDDDDDDDGWHRGRGWWHHYVYEPYAPQGAVVYSQAPAYVYSPPPVVYASPPVVYAPPPVLYTPAPSLNVVIPIHFR